MKPKAINPKETTRSEAFELWMSAPNPMVTFFKQINVINLVRIRKKYKLKFKLLYKKNIIYETHLLYIG